MCRDVGIPTHHTITGPELDKLDEHEYATAVARATVLAKLTPLNKAQVGLLPTAVHQIHALLLHAVHAALRPEHLQQQGYNKRSTRSSRAATRATCSAALVLPLKRLNQGCACALGELLQVVCALKDQGLTVGFLGDGVNDAAALRRWVRLSL